MSKHNSNWFDFIKQMYWFLIALVVGLCVMWYYSLSQPAFFLIGVIAICIYALKKSCDDSDKVNELKEQNADLLHRLENKNIEK